MATKDISDKLVCMAFSLSQHSDHKKFPYEILAEWTSQPEKVCYRAMERASERGLVEYGVSLRTGWLTEKGKDLIKEVKE